jgi:hypothetical protein
MVFWRISQKELPESKNFPRHEMRKRLKENSYQNGTTIATKETPVMCRLLESIRPAHRRKDTRQDKTPTKRPSKGERQTGQV